MYQEIIRFNLLSIFGRAVFVTMLLTWTSRGAASGNVTIDLPFATSSLGSNPRYLFYPNFVNNLNVFSGSTTGTYQMSGSASGGSSTFNVYESRDNTAPANTQANSVSASGEMHWAGFFFI